MIVLHHRFIKTIYLIELCLNLKMKFKKHIGNGKLFIDYISIFIILHFYLSFKFIY